MNNENICSICYEELENSDENPNIYKLECNHVYHSSCIIKWFRSGHNNCPLCNDTTIDTHLSYYEKISTIEEIKKLGRRKSCPLNIKNILTKIKNCTKEKKEHEKIFNEFKKTHKLIYNTEKNLRRNKYKCSRKIRLLEHKLLAIINITPIYIKK